MNSGLSNATEMEEAEAILLSVANSNADPGIDNDNTDDANDTLLEIALRDHDYAKPTSRVFRIYNLIARPISGEGEEIIEKDLISTVAGRRRKMYRRNGYRVDLIETNSGDGTVIRIPDTLGGKGVPNPIPYDSPRNRSRNRSHADRIRNAMLNAENHRLLKAAERKQNDKCFIYRKSDNALQFAGSPEETAQYLTILSESGNLNLEDLVINIPDHIMRKYGRNR